MESPSGSRALQYAVGDAVRWRVPGIFRGGAPYELAAHVVTVNAHALQIRARTEDGRLLFRWVRPLELHEDIDGNA